MTKILVNGEVRDATQQEIDEITAQQNEASTPSRDELKRLRQSAVNAITVNVNGKIFQGDETSQERLARAVQVAAITAKTDTLWTLADNTEVSVTVDELKQALALAGLRQQELWNLDQYMPPA